MASVAPMSLRASSPVYRFLVREGIQVAWDLEELVSTAQEPAVSARVRALFRRDTLSPVSLADPLTATRCSFPCAAVPAVAGLETFRRRGGAVALEVAR